MNNISSPFLRDQQVDLKLPEMVDKILRRCDQCQGMTPEMSSRASVKYWEPGWGEATMTRPHAPLSFRRLQSCAVLFLCISFTEHQTQMPPLPGRAVCIVVWVTNVTKSTER